VSLLSPRAHWSAVRELAGLLSRHRELTWEMTKREVRDRYTRHILGSAWAICHPLILVAVYLFLFVIVLKAKIPRDLPFDFTTYLLSGLLPWLAFQESMNKNVAAVTSNSNLVKQVVFPLEVLPAKGVLSSMLPQLVGTVALIVYVLLKHGSLPWTYLLLPALILMQCAWMIGAGFFLSSVGAYFRDMKDIVQVFSFVGVFLMPVFYLPAKVPSMFKPIIYCNPFSYMVWCYQDACYFGRFEHPWAWGVFAALSLGTLYMGYLVFRRLKMMFGNVL